MDLSVRVFSSYKHIRFILYSVVLCNFFHIHSEAFSSAYSFFPQGFSRKSGIYFFLLYFIIVPLISTTYKLILLQFPYEGILKAPHSNFKFQMLLQIVAERESVRSLIGVIKFSSLFYLSIKDLLFFANPIMFV